MRIFFILLKKEIKEMLTPQLLISLVGMIFIFYVIGKVVGAQKKNSSGHNNVVVMDLDKSVLSKRIIKSLIAGKYTVKDASKFDLKTTLGNSEYKDESFFMVIPAGLKQDFDNGKKHEIKVYARFKKNLSGYGSAISAKKIRKAVESVSKDMSLYIIKKNSTAMDAEFLRKPLLTKEFVVIGETAREISVGKVLAFVRTQAYFFPIAVFFIVLIAAQIVMTTVASEKENKTLETLLSSPIDRRALIISKLSASALIAVALSGGYMLGMRSFMAGIMGQKIVEAGAASSTPQAQGAMLTAAVSARTALTELGLIIDPMGYLMIGVSVLFCILCALAIALILGVLSEDVKSIQTMITPLMMALLISYLLPIFIDINSSSVPVKLLLYAIPFTHAFIAPQNIMLHNHTAVIWGIVYQAVVFCVFVAVAGKIFSGETLLTLKFKLKNFAEK